MSFGYRDEDWVDPDPDPEVTCEECSKWEPCPCGCGWGVCSDCGEFTYQDDDC